MHVNKKKFERNSSLEYCYWKAKHTSEREVYSQLNSNDIYFNNIISCQFSISSGRTCKEKKNLMRFRGQFTLSLDCARQGTSYKYVVVKKGVVHWEYLPEFPSRHYGAIVNRFLSIPEKYLQPGGKVLIACDLKFVIISQSNASSFYS